MENRGWQDIRRSTPTCGGPAAPRIWQRIRTRSYDIWPRSPKNVGDDSSSGARIECVDADANGNMSKNRLIVGDRYDGVMLETCRTPDVSRPRVRPVSHFPSDIFVRFPRDLREDFPVGTRFRAAVKVCQKTWDHSGKPKGPPYLHASRIEMIIGSIPDPGLRAKLKPGTVSGRTYIYVMD